MRNKNIQTATMIAFGLFIGSAQAGPDWIEDGDAGSSVDAAQDTTTIGVVNTIAGRLGGSDREDVYRLIVEGADDVSSTVNFGFLPGSDPDFNPALWLFDTQGYGILGNDDDPLLGGPGARLIAPSTDGVTLQLAPGIYFLAITESGNVPLSMRPEPSPGAGVFEEIFFFESLTEVSGPDGAGADNPLAGWSGGNGSNGNYGIAITPAPAGFAAFSLMGLAASRRRR